MAERLTELDACGYVVGSEGKLTNASSPFLPSILMVQPDDDVGAGLSDSAFACATVRGGVGRPADMDTFELLLGLLVLRSGRVESATGGAGALFAASGKSGTTGLYGLLRNGGTKNGLGVLASDGAGDLLTRSLS